MKLTNKINHETQIVGILGHPIKHSYSPRMHNMTFENQNLNCIYLPFDIPASNLKDALKSLITLGIKGVNVTIPHKERIIQYLDHVSEAASSVGAVNTIVNQSGQLYGYNTDVDGIIETLLPYKNDIAKNSVTIIGAGGAARAVLYTLIRHFKVGKINIINRTEERSESLKDYFLEKMHFNNIDVYELMAKENVEVYNSSKLIINATSIGLFPNIDDTPTDLDDSFNPNQIVFDLIYNPLKTKFLKIAESKGATIINGLKMFVVQGAKSYELWTDKTMDVDKTLNELKKQF